MLLTKHALPAKTRQNKLQSAIDYIGNGKVVVLTMEIDRKLLPLTWDVYSFDTIDIQTSNIERLKRINFDFMIIKNLHRKYDDERKLIYKVSLSNYISEAMDVELMAEFGDDKPFSDSDTYTIVRHKRYVAERKKVTEVIGSKSSDYSESGKFTLDEEAAYLYAIGVKKWMPTESYSLRFSKYGKTINLKSVLSIGIDKYLSHISKLQYKYPGMQIIPGVEIMDGSYWTGSLFKFNLILHGGTKSYWEILPKNRVMVKVRDVYCGENNTSKVKHQFAYFEQSSNCYEYGKKGWTSRLDEIQ
jgi:hypothetical protein